MNVFAVSIIFDNFWLKC